MTGTEFVKSRYGEHTECIRIMGNDNSMGEDQFPRLIDEFEQLKSCGYEDNELEIVCGKDGYMEVIPKTALNFKGDGEVYKHKICTKLFWR